jgi:hypothetical protein
MKDLVSFFALLHLSKSVRKSGNILREKWRVVASYCTRVLSEECIRVEIAFAATICTFVRQLLFVFFFLIAVSAWA